MKTRWRLLFFLIGIVGMVIMFISLEPQNVNWEEFLSIELLLLFLILFALWAIIYLVHALSYYVILGKEGKKIKFFTMMKICISGFALNSVTPAGLVGGEPYRIMEMKRFCSIEKASSATLTFSLFYVIGHVLAWLATVIIYLALGCPGDTLYTVILSVSGVVCLGVTALFYFSKRKGIVYPFMRFLGKIPVIKKPIGKLNQKNASRFAEIDNNIRDFRTRKSFWVVLGLQFLSRVIEAVEYLIIFIYLKQQINYLDAFLVFGTASLIANIIFMIPMQAGTREGGLLIALSFIGLGSELCTPASLIYRVRDLMCIFFGVILVVITKKSKEEKKLIAEQLGMKAAEDNENVTKDTEQPSQISDNEKDISPAKSSEVPTTVETTETPKDSE